MCFMVLYIEYELDVFFAVEEAEGVEQVRFVYVDIAKNNVILFNSMPISRAIRYK